MIGPLRAMKDMIGCFGRAAVLLAFCGATLVPATAHAQDNPRAFPSSGYTLADEAIWTFFSQHGGSAVFGDPISREFNLYESPVQLFERAVLQLRPDGAVQVMPLTGPGPLPYTHMAGLTLPAPDPALAFVAPSPDQLNYTSRRVEFLRATVPDAWNGQPLQFFSVLTADSVDVWGMPTSSPTADPRNPSFVYQRFQNGILLFNAASSTTDVLPLGSYLKALLTGQGLPADLTADAAQSPLLGQYDPSKPRGLVHQDALPGTDLTDAFTPDAG